MRTIFNNIISTDNLEPKPNTEYIYNFNMIWYADLDKKIAHMGHIDIEIGTIVENVEQMEAGGYDFNIKGNSEKYHCNYGWAFIENAERNKKILVQIKWEEEIMKQQESKILNLRKELDSLYKF
jgi:hypothetical protein